MCYCLLSVNRCLYRRLYDDGVVFIAAASSMAMTSLSSLSLWYVMMYAISRCNRYHGINRRLRCGSVVLGSPTVFAIAVWRHFEGISEWRHFEGIILWRHFEGISEWRHFEGITVWRHFEGITAWRHFDGRTVVTALDTQLFLTAYWRHNARTIWRHYKTRVYLPGN